MTEQTEAPPEAPTTEPPAEVPDDVGATQVDPGLKPIEDIDITVEGLALLGVPYKPGDKISPKDKVPGLELNWEQAAFLDITMPHGLKTLQDVKADPNYANIDLFFIPGQKRKYVFRATTRREWTNWVRQTRTFPERLKIEEDTKETPEAAGGQIRTLMEELTFQKFCIVPQLSVDQVRDLPPGEVTGVYEAYMNAIGYQDMPPPVIKI